MIGIYTHSIIFLNTTHEQGVLYPGDATLGIATLQYWLADAGLTDTAVFPEDDTCNVHTIEAKFRKYLETHNAAVYALSCWSNTFTTAVLYARIIRELKPGALITGGGAHFHSRDNVIKALNGGLFDIVFRGGADPFFEFCKNFFMQKDLTINHNGKGLNFTGKLPSSGMFYRHNGAIVPRRHGVLTKAVLPVMHITDEFAEITALFSDACGNNCDYCTVFKNKADKNTRRQAEELVIDAYNQLKQIHDGTFRISIMDSSPFIGENRSQSYETIKRLSALDDRIVFSVLADPADLDADFIAFMEKYPVQTFFVGRDSVTEDSFIGRRLNGALRSQIQLDNERTLLGNFIRRMSDDAKEIYIGYIASPYATAEDAHMLLDELEEFTHNIGVVRPLVVQPNIFILNPYGGTAVCRKAGKKAWDIGEFSYPYPNVWNDSETRMIWLELLRLVVSPVFSTGLRPDVGMVLLRFAAAMEFGMALPSVDKLSGVLATAMGDFMLRVVAMRLGEEKSITDWHGHLLEIYWWGLALTLAVKKPEIAEKYGILRLMDFIKREDIMVNTLKADFSLIESKPHGETWYERFVDLA